MTPQRKITVSLSIRCDDRACDSPDTALETVRSALDDLDGTLHDAIVQDLEDAGAKGVSIRVVTY